MSGKTKLTRHQCRELIFKLLFAKEFHKEADPKEYYDSYIEITEEPTAEYVENVFVGVCQCAQEIDAEIEEYSIKWKMSRMSTATRTILRLAVYEMTKIDVPAKVVLNEERCIAAVRNAGIKAAQGKYIMTIDCDNRMTKGTMREAYNLLRSGRFIGGGAPIRFERYSLPLYLNDYMCRVGFGLTGLYCGIFWASKETFETVFTLRFEIISFTAASSSTRGA